MSTDQSLATKVEALTAADYGTIYAGNKSGRTGVGLHERGRALDQLRIREQLVVACLYCLPRSVGHPHRQVKEINAAGASFRCLHQGGVDTTTNTGKVMLAICDAAAEFERHIRRERQRDDRESDGVGRVPETASYIEEQRIASIANADLGAAEIGPRLAAISHRQRGGAV